MTDAAQHNWQNLKSLSDSEDVRLLLADGVTEVIGYQRTWGAGAFNKSYMARKGQPIAGQIFGVMKWRPL